MSQVVGHSLDQLDEHLSRVERGAGTVPIDHLMGWTRWARARHMKGSTQQSERFSAMSHFFAAQRYGGRIDWADLPSDYGQNAPHEAETYDLYLSFWLTLLELYRDETNSSSAGLAVTEFTKQIVAWSSISDTFITEWEATTRLASSQRWLAVRTADAELAQSAVLLLEDSLPDGANKCDTFKYLNNLANARLAVFDLKEDQRILFGAWQAILEAWDVAWNPQTRAMAASNVANIGRRLFGITSDIDLLYQADQIVASDAVNLLIQAETSPNSLISHLHNGRSLVSMNLFMVLGDRSRLDRSVIEARCGYTWAEYSSDVVTVLSTLSNALATRFDHFGHNDDLEEAIASTEHILTISDPGDPSHAHYLSNLSGYLAQRSRHQSHKTMAYADGNRALSLARKALARERYAMDRARTLEAVARCALNLHEIGGASEYLTEAVKHAEESLTTTSEEDPELARRYFLLATVREHRARDRLAKQRKLLPHYELRGSWDGRRTTELERNVLLDLISLYNSAVSTGERLQQERAASELKLGDVYEELHSLDGDLSAAEAALTAWTAAASQLTADPDVRFEACARRGRLSDALGLRKIALQAYIEASETLTDLVWLGFSLRQRQALLRNRTWVIREGVRLAIEAEDIETAIELFEAGRQLIWKQAADLVGDTLRFEESQALQNLLRIRSQLAVLEGLHSTNPGGTKFLQDGREVDEERRQLFEQYANSLEMLRKRHMVRPPVENFKHGCRVLLNLTPTISHAIVWLDDVWEIVVLDRLHWDEASNWSNRIRMALTRCANSPGSSRQRWRANRIVGDCIDWMSDVLSPVLHSVADRDVVWVVSGALSTLPVHLCGYGATARRLGVSPRTSSYGASVYPTAAAPPPAGGGDLTVVSAPITAAGSLDELRFADTEISGLQTIPGLAIRVLRSPDKTAFKSWFSDAERIHIICHGSVDDADPTNNVLAVIDGTISLRDLLASSPKCPEWAYVSACDTAAVSIGFGEEALNVAGALQMAGYPQVVGTLWQINDRFAAEFASRLYGEMVVDGAWSPDTAPEAMSRVVSYYSRIRRRDVIHWAPYVLFVR